MNLHYRQMGEGEALIILHGLYGSSDNWLNIAKELAGDYQVYLPDLRNHGRSPHSQNHTYPEMAGDILNFMDERGLGQAHILGHSMGGKAAIYFAVDHPERIRSLIAVDIAPTAYPQTDESNQPVLNHLNITSALCNLDPGHISTIRQADDQLAQAIPYQQVRQFLLKNLKRNKQTGQFEWLLNIEAIRNELPKIMEGLDPKAYQNQGITSFPILFIKGEQSPYIGEKQMEEIRTIFPHARIETIEKAGHWVHAQKRGPFIRLVKEFLSAH